MKEARERLKAPINIRVQTYTLIILMLKVANSEATRNSIHNTLLGYRAKNSSRN